MLNDSVILFDLDGTLVDTAPDLVDTLNEVTRAHGGAELSPGTVRPFIGRGAKVMIEQSLAANGVRLDGKTLSALHTEYLGRYESRIARLSRPFPNLGAALDRLEAEGARFAVCTNKLEHLAKRLLDELGLSPRFRLIAGPDTFGAAKPDPAMLLAAIEAAGGRRERALMVGDSAIDRDAARAAALPFVGVTFGYTEIPLDELSPDCLIDDFAALPEAAADLLG